MEGPAAGVTLPLCVCVSTPSMEVTMIARSDAACFVGIDLHKDALTACTIAAKDRGVSYRKIACVARKQVREFLAGLAGPSVVAIG